MIEELAARICRLKKPHTLRVAVDGVDGAGKTTPIWVIRAGDAPDRRHESRFVGEDVVEML